MQFRNLKQHGWYFDFLGFRLQKDCLGITIFRKGV